MRKYPQNHFGFNPSLESVIEQNLENLNQYAEETIKESKALSFVKKARFYLEEEGENPVLVCLVERRDGETLKREFAAACEALDQAVEKCWLEGFYGSEKTEEVSSFLEDGNGSLDRGFLKAKEPQLYRQKCQESLLSAALERSSGEMTEFLSAFNS